MEVGDEAIGDLEFIRWMNELISPSLVWLHDATCENARFKRTHDAAADRIDVLLRL